MLSVFGFKFRATLQHCEVRVRGLPVFIAYVVLSGNRRPGLPEGCPGYKKTRTWRAMGSRTFQAPDSGSLAGMERGSLSSSL